MNSCKNQEREIVNSSDDVFVTGCLLRKARRPRNERVPTVFCTSKFRNIVGRVDTKFIRVRQKGYKTRKSSSVEVLRRGVTIDAYLRVTTEKAKSNTEADGERPWKML